MRKAHANDVHTKGKKKKTWTRVHGLTTMWTQGCSFGTVTSVSFDQFELICVMPYVKTCSENQLNACLVTRHQLDLLMLHNYEDACGYASLQWLQR